MSADNLESNPRPQGNDPEQSVENQYRIRKFNLKDLLLGFLLILTLILGTVLVFMMVPLIFSAFSTPRTLENQNRKNASNTLDFLRRHNLVSEDKTLNFSGITFGEHRTIINSYIEHVKKTEPSKTGEGHIASFSSLSEWSIKAEQSIYRFYDALAFQKQIEIESIVLQTVNVLLQDISEKSHFLFFDFLINSIALIEMLPPKQINYREVIPTFDNIKKAITSHNSNLNLKQNYINFLKNAFFNSFFDGQQISLDITHGGTNRTLAISIFSRKKFSQLILFEMTKSIEPQFFKFLLDPKLKNTEYLTEIKNFLAETSDIDPQIKHAIEKYLLESSPVNKSELLSWFSVFFILSFSSLLALILKQKSILDTSSKKFETLAKDIIIEWIGQENIFCDSTAIHFIEKTAFLHALKGSTLFDDYFIISRLFSQREQVFKEKLQSSIKKIKTEFCVKIDLKPIHGLSDFIVSTSSKNSINIDIRGSNKYLKINDSVFERKHLFILVYNLFLSGMISYDEKKLSFKLRTNTFIKKEVFNKLIEDLKKLKVLENLSSQENHFQSIKKT